MIFPPQTSGFQIKKHGIGRKCETYEDRFMRRSGGERKRKRQLGRARCKWDFNIKKGVMEIFWRA